MNNELAPHLWLREPRLSFHPDRASDCDIHPLRGLLRFGPYSHGLVPKPIRVATLAPAGESRPLYEFMKQLNGRFEPRERKGYLPAWEGFQRVFGLTMQGAGGDCHYELDPSLDRELGSSQTPHVALAERLIRAIHLLRTRRERFDILFILMPKRWAPGFYGGPDEDFDLHHHLKATTAEMGMPIQLVREDSALSYRDRASVMWRIGLALYAKAGGVPWKLSDTDPETAYIGLSYAVRPVSSDRPRFVTCCSQVFDAEGSGLEFVAYDASEVEVHRKNPFLSQTEMFRVMNRSIELYRRRHAGRTPRRVMVHKTTEFKRDEVDGCMEAFHLCEAVDLVQIVADVGWRGVKIGRGYSGEPEGQPTGFPVERGTLLDISPRDALLWTHGDVSGINGNRSYFKGERSTPKPIRLVRHAGHGPWDETARAILGLSKMNWNNDSLYDALPVTLSYASILAQVVKRMNRFRSTPYQFRFFM